jgi:hypothetical protein
MMVFYNILYILNLPYFNIEVNFSGYTWIQSRKIYLSSKFQKINKENLLDNPGFHALIK